MRFTRTILMTLMWIALSASGAFCQTAKSEYQRLVSEFKATKTSQDSIQRLIDMNRGIVETTPEKRDMIAQIIISLEDELYTLNAKITKFSNAIASIEPDRAEITGNTPAGGTFAFKNTAAIEAQIATISRTIPPLYAELQECKQQYAEAKTPAAVEELLEQSKHIKAKITAADSLVGDIWTPVYDKKIDSYLVTVDKINGIDRLQLEQIDNEARAARRREALASESIAPNTIIYPAQKSLLAKYELLIANMLDLKAASDSISKVISSPPKEMPSYPDIVFEPRSFVIYSGIELGAKYEGMVVDSIPELVVPKTGAYYTVQVLLTANRPTSFASFRGAEPLRATRAANKMYQYTAGGFGDYKSALAAVTKLQRAGYRNTLVILAWVDGALTTTAKARAAEETVVKNNTGNFSVEVKTRNQTLINTLRAIVDEHSADKQITRAIQADDTLFSIFPFSDRAQADNLAKIIKAKENTTVEVITLN